MGQLAEKDPLLRRDDGLFIVDVKEVYYHIRLTAVLQKCLEFVVTGGVYIKM